MTTTYSQIIAAAFPYAQAQAIHDAMEAAAPPTGERYFADRATHTDADGIEWLYVEASARPECAESSGSLAEQFPDARFAVVAQVVGATEIDDRPVVWQDGDRAMVRLGVDLTDKLERIVVEDMPHAT